MLKIMPCYEKNGASFLGVCILSCNNDNVFLKATWVLTSASEGNSTGHIEKAAQKAPDALANSAVLHNMLRSFVS